MMDDIFLGLPNIGLIRTELMMWVMQSNFKYICPIQAKPHDACRNLIVSYFLQTKIPWLLMIDSDVVPLTNVWEMKDNNVPVCSAHVSTCRGKEVIPVGMTRADNNEGYFHEFKNSNPEGAPHKVDAVGTGCIIIHREVFATLDKPYFKFVYDDNGFLQCGEDFDFCERVGNIYFDPRHKAAHYTIMAI